MSLTVGIEIDIISPVQVVMTASDAGTSYCPYFVFRGSSSWGCGRMRVRRTSSHTRARLLHLRQAGAGTSVINDVRLCGMS